MKTMQSFGFMIHVEIVTHVAECLLLQSEASHTLIKLKGAAILSLKGSQH